MGATIYFGSDESRPADRRGRARRSRWRTRWAWPPCCGATCATPPFKKDKDYHVSADLTGQANHLGVTIEADIIKQKLPENNGGYNALSIEGEPLRQDRQADLHAAHHRPPDRPDALPGGQLLHGPRGPHQLRRRVGRERLRRGGEDGGDQQARRRHGPHLRPQGVPAADGGGRQAAQRDPGRVPGDGRSRSPEPFRRAQRPAVIARSERSERRGNPGAAARSSSTVERTPLRSSPGLASSACGASSQ
ncbi:MAG: hypothetical protein MZV64_30070 [Ignavibacteriales bacterium]|nr:hypothetical protein [Ignavibacteriales bacterium]